MKWNIGQPLYTGEYLCAVIGRSQPVELYWNGSSWIYLSEGEYADNDEVHYYMNLSDIPMPENW